MADESTDSPFVKWVKGLTAAVAAVAALVAAVTLLTGNGQKLLNAVFAKQANSNTNAAPPLPANTVPPTAPPAVSPDHVIISCNQIGSFTIDLKQGHAFEGQLPVYIADDVFGMYYYDERDQKILRLYLSRIDMPVKSVVNVYPLSPEGYARFVAFVSDRVANETDPVAKGRASIANGDAFMKQIGATVTEQSNPNCEVVTPKSVD